MLEKVINNFYSTVKKLIKPIVKMTIGYKIIINIL